MSLNFSDNRISTDYTLSTQKPEAQKVDGFRLTSTWVGAGDSWTAGVAGMTPYAPQLATKTNTTLVSQAAGGRCIDYATSNTTNINNIIKNTSFANRSTIMQFGINDYRNTGSWNLYNNNAQWQSCALSAYIAHGLPQNKIIDARDFVTKTAGWINSPQAFGMRTVTNNAYLETPATGRYYSFSFYINNTTDALWQISIDGVIIANKTIKYQSNQENFYMQTVAIDMKTVATRTIRVTNLAANGTIGISDRFFCYAGVWTGTETNMRDVLVVSQPIFDWVSRPDFAETTATTARFTYIRNSIKAAVQDAQLLGLRVFFYDNSYDSNGLFLSDCLHLTTTGASQLADKLIENSIANIG